MMSGYKIKIAFFTIPEFENEQSWLEEQHRKGWAFRNIMFPGFLYFFEACEPEEVIYRLDYNPEGLKDKLTYVQMFKDCNWDHITDFLGYSYFKKPMKDREPMDTEIFNDYDSKLEMSKRVFKGRMIPLIILFFTIILPQLILHDPIATGTRIYIYIALFIIYIVIFIKFGIQYYKLKGRATK